MPLQYGLPRSEWKTKPGGGWRLNHAIRNASVTRLACMCVQPTTWRLNGPITVARYSQPPSVAMQLMSLLQARSGALGLKSPANRFGSRSSPTAAA